MAHTIQSQGSKLRRIGIDASFLCLALALSYLEAIIPLTSVIPIPGFKLGLANIAVTAAAFLFSPIDAAAVSLSRVIVSSFLFGNPSTFLYSLAGASLAFVGICISRVCLWRVSGWIGISVLCAALHNIGQLIAASVVLSSLGVMWYLPILLIAASVTGAFGGIILTMIMLPLRKLKNKLLPENSIPAERR